MTQAGSSTTAHAVLELNREDGGNRSFTLVTNDQNGIGTNICYERLFWINNGLSTNNKSFNWIEKNEPFKSNLDVFRTIYFDTSITNGQNDLIKQTFIKQLQNFNIYSSNKIDNINDRDLLVSLTALKPMKKDDDINGSK